MNVLVLLPEDVGLTSTGGRPSITGAVLFIGLSVKIGWMFSWIWVVNWAEAWKCPCSGVEALPAEEKKLLPWVSWLFGGGLNPFHHDFKLCFVGGDVVWEAAVTGAGCGVAKGCCEDDEAGNSEAIFTVTGLTC